MPTLSERKPYTRWLRSEVPCPKCGKAVKLNPFTINANWHPIAAAWAGGPDQERT